MSTNHKLCLDRLNSCQPHLHNDNAEGFLKDAQKYYELLKKDFKKGDPDALKLADFISFGYAQKLAEVKQKRFSYFL